jgi:hypothetical protein
MIIVLTVVWNWTNSVAIERMQQGGYEQHDRADEGGNGSKVSKRLIGA